MKLKNDLIIFDLDGTLYKFDTEKFVDSRFYKDIKERAYGIIQGILQVTEEEARSKYNSINEKYNNQTSIGFEKEFGISRLDYFSVVWDADPSKYIVKENLRGKFASLEGRVAILTAGPRIWAERVIKYLEVEDFFKNSLFTGEPDIRKPNPVAFKQVLDYFNVSHSNSFSIGDQESSDIIPAMSLGMRTIIIGKSNLAEFQVSSLNEALEIINQEDRK